MSIKWSSWSRRLLQPCSVLKQWDCNARTGQWELLLAENLTGNTLQGEDGNWCPPEGHPEGLWECIGPSDTYREQQPNHDSPPQLTIILAACSVSVSLFCPQQIGSGSEKSWGQKSMGCARNAGHSQWGDPPGQTTHSNSLSIQFLFWNFNENEVCSSVHSHEPSQWGLFSLTKEVHRSYLSPENSALTELGCCRGKFFFHHKFLCTLGHRFLLVMGIYCSLSLAGLKIWPSSLGSLESEEKFASQQAGANRRVDTTF